MHDKIFALITFFVLLCKNLLLLFEENITSAIEYRVRIEYRQLKSVFPNDISVFKDSNVNYRAFKQN